MSAFGNKADIGVGTFCAPPGNEITSNVRGPNRHASSGGNAGVPSGHASSDATAHPSNSRDRR